MTGWAAVLIGIPVGLTLYAYAGYPLLLWLAARGRRVEYADPAEWPMVSVSLPAYNEEARIARAIEAWLAVDYPSEAMQILVVSDASTDATDEIVRSYADRGVELLRQPRRAGKTAAENAAIPHLRGQLVINTDASVEVVPDAVKPLVRAFSDPSVGVSSGRDVSTGGDTANASEGGYVGYEMWVRDLETRTGSIVGASGCYYAIRKPLHERPVDPQLSRDFASALTAREMGFRAVSIPDAICLVPRTDSLRKEFRRKIRTMARGMDTLLSRRQLLNPARHGWFAVRLWSHKVARWMVPLVAPLAVVGVLLLAAERGWLLPALGVCLTGLALSVLALRWPENRPMPRLLSIIGFAAAANFAAVIAAWKVLRGGRDGAIWEPTRRP